MLLWGRMLLPLWNWLIQPKEDSWAVLTSLVNWCFWASPVELSVLVEIQAATGEEQSLLPLLRFSLMWVLATAERKMGVLRYI